MMNKEKWNKIQMNAEVPCKHCGEKSPYKMSVVINKLSANGGEVSLIMEQPELTPHGWKYKPSMREKVKHFVNNLFTFCK